MKKTVIWTIITIVAITLVMLTVNALGCYDNLPVGWIRDAAVLRCYLQNRHVWLDYTIAFGGIFATIYSIIRIRKELDKEER